MSKDIAKLVIRMEAQTKKYDQKLDQANKKIKRFHMQQRKSLKGISSDFKTILGGVAVGLFVRKIVNATKEQEQAVAQLEQGLATTGNAVGYSLEQLTKKAEELQKATTFGDEGIIQAMSQLVTFTGITKDQFDRTTVAVLDLATRMDGDLKGSVVQLGKALNDPVANLSALSRSGIQFNTTQKAMIKDLVESNKLMEAQDIILTELEKQFGGSAAAARDTFGGALEGLTGAFNDLFEASGDLDGAKESVESLTTTLQDPEIKAGINALISGMVQLAAHALRFASSTANGVSNISSALVDMSSDATDAESALNDLFNEFGSGRVGGPSDDAISDNVNILQAMTGFASEEELEAYLKRINGSLTAAKQKLANSANPDGLKLPQMARDGGAAIFNPENIEKEIAVYGQLRTSILDALDAKAEILETVVAPVSVEVEKLSLPKPTEAHIDAFKDYNAEMQKLADTITIANVPAAKFESELAKLNEVWDSGKLGAEAYSSAFLSLLEDFEGLPDKTEEVAGEMDEFAEQAARNMQDAFADFLFDPFDEGLDGMLKGFLKILQQMAAQQLAKTIFQGLPALFGAAIPGGAPVVDALPTMNGGGFTGSGPRVAGVDGLGGFLAILHPNETVTDHTLQGSAKGGGGITIAPQFSLSAIDSRGMSDVIQEQQGAIISVIDQYLNEKGIAAI